MNSGLGPNEYAESAAKASRNLGIVFIVLSLLALLAIVDERFNDRPGNDATIAIVFAFSVIMLLFLGFGTALILLYRLLLRASHRTTLTALILASALTGLMGLIIFNDLRRGVGCSTIISFTISIMAGHLVILCIQSIRFENSKSSKRGFEPIIGTTSREQERPVARSTHPLD